MDQRLQNKIDVWSMRPQPGTPHGDTWESGAEQGWEWSMAEIERLRAMLDEVCGVVGAWQRTPTSDRYSTEAMRSALALRDIAKSIRGHQQNGKTE